MMQPLKVNANALYEIGFDESDVKNLAAIYSFVDSLNSLGNRSSFSEILTVLGQARDMINRCNALNDGVERASNRMKKSGKQWAEHFGISILDADGWGGKFPKSLDDNISVYEFVQRASKSTISGGTDKVNILFDYISANMAPRSKN